MRNKCTFNSIGFYILSVFFIVPNFVFSQENKMNVLLILVDDLRPSIGAFGDRLAITPHLDQFAKQAHVFERAYSNQAVCVASRYNLLLGARSTSTGLYDFGRAFRDFYPNATTLPEFFKNSGYHTEAIGKVFHVGHNTYNDEQSWSIPHYHDKVIEYVAKKSVKMTREEALFSNISWDEANKLAKGAAWENPDVADDAYADGRVANRAMARLAELKSSDQPFFMAVGFARPHLPFSVPKKYWDLYDEKIFHYKTSKSDPLNAPKFATKRDGEISQYNGIPLAQQIHPFPDSLTYKLRHGYYAGVSYVDVQIGKVINKLKEEGLDKNTIVVLWGDHGYLLGEMGMWTKHVNYEIANRIPLVFYHPDFKKGRKTKALVETVDIYPTLVDLCGLALAPIEQPLDGKSIKHIINGDIKSTKDHVYHCFPRDGRLGEAIRTKDYRLVRWTPMNGKGNIVYELYDYRKGLVELENIWRPDHPAFLKLNDIMEKYPKTLPMRPESPRRVN